MLHKIKLLLRPKKVVLFPEIGWVKIFSSLTRLHSRMCSRLYIFNFKKKKTKKKHKKTKKAKETNWTKENICRKSNGIQWYSLRNLPCVLLTYLIESWISPSCSYEFNVVYVQREKSYAGFVILQQYMKYTLSRTKIK